MDGISAIPIFVAVTEQGGFAAAGRELGVSKSAVSKRISQLEARLGMQLLHRTTRKLSLTEAGERYLENAVIALAAAREAEDAVAELQGDPIGELKISVPMSFGRLHVAPLIPEFLKQYPKIELNMVMDDRFVDLVEGRFDMAIRAGTLPDSSLIARKIAPCHNVLCASPEYLAKYGEPKEPKELIHHNCIHYSYFSDFNEWTFIGANDLIRIETSGQYQVNNSEALLEAVLGGIGVTRLPTFVAGPHIKTGRLVRILKPYGLPLQTIYAVFRERKYLPSKVRAFSDFLVNRLGKGTPAWDA